jgi:Ca-activated chloride channel family protein
MLAVDLSGSMDAKDFELGNRRVDRLTATKAVASDFIGRREGDRLGLILFGERAYLQVPLTLDRETVNVLLMEAFIGLAGEKTAIGDAITLAVKLIHDKEADARDQVLVLLTDGANTAGQVDPLKAAELASQVGLRIYTIGIGAEQMMISSLTGGMRRVNPSADLDEETLTRIARMTGGRYFRATDTASLQQIYRILDEMEPVAERERHRLEQEVLPRSPLGEALRYVDNQWRALQRYTEDGRLQIDNNGAERQLRAVAVGRKNWLFAGSMEGAKRAALLYSLIQSCQLAGVDPFQYLQDVLLRIATHPHARIAELTPLGWASTFGPNALSATA